MKWNSIAVNMAAILLIAILSGLGVGSGGLLVIWLTMVQGVEAVQARGMNLLFFVFSASAALLFHLKRGTIRVKLVLWLAGFALLGTLAGVWISGFLDPFWLRKGFGAVLIGSGLYTLLGKGKQNRVLLFPAQKSEFAGQKPRK